MKKLSTQKLSKTVIQRRKSLNMTQQDLATKADINRSILSRLESNDYIPSIPQLESLAESLGFDLTDMFIEDSDTEVSSNIEQHKIAVAGTGYVGLSLAVLLAQHNPVTAVDVVKEKVDF